MLENPTFMCIDAGGENCPCVLAESGNCVACGRLSGHDCTECKWHGVCIYNEYLQNHRRVKNNRKDFEADIVERIVYDEETVLIGLSVGKGFALKCYAAGVYVFLRKKGSEEYFNAPISVLKADTERGIIYLLIKGISAKTKPLIKEDRSLNVRGPYKNGIFGLEELYSGIKTAKQEGRKYKILIVAKATGIAPALKLMQSLGEAHYICLVADLTNLDKRIISKTFIPNSDKLIELDLNKPKDIQTLKHEFSIGEYDSLAVFTSDYYINLISELAEEIGFEGKIALSNNFNLCCGEGVCGACSVAGKNGETLKMCKCRLSGGEILKRKVIYK